MTKFIRNFYKKKKNIRVEQIDICDNFHYVWSEFDCFWSANHWRSFFICYVIIHCVVFYSPFLRLHFRPMDYGFLSIDKIR